MVSGRAPRGLDSSWGAPGRKVHISTMEGFLRTVSQFWVDFITLHEGFHGASQGCHVLWELPRFLMLQLLECPEDMSVVKFLMSASLALQAPSPRAPACPKARRQFFNLLIFQAD